MPYFTRQVAPNGSLLVIALIGVSQARRNALVSAQQPVPNVVQVQALIDTGASCVCVDPSVLKQLNLSPTGSTAVNSPTTGSQPINVSQYDVSLAIHAIAGHAPLVFQTVPAIEAELLAAQFFHVIIGRDILQWCLLTYDGRARMFSLAY